MTRVLRATAFAVALVMTSVPGPSAASIHPAGPPLTCGGLAVTIVGTNGPEVIVGTPGNDVIAGLGGDDEIYGGDGEDVICGGTGDDYIEGQGDEDILFGDQGDDILDGGSAGCCDVPSNTGDDVISGGQGDDVIHSSDFPQAGNSLYGDQGNDTIFLWRAGLAIGARGFVSGGNGDDTIFQFTGDALIEGGNGRDSITDWDDGAENNDTMRPVEKVVSFFIALAAAVFGGAMTITLFFAMTCATLALSVAIGGVAGSSSSLVVMCVLLGMLATSGVTMFFAACLVREFWRHSGTPGKAALLPARRYWSAPSRIPN